MKSKYCKIQELQVKLKEEKSSDLKLLNNLNEDNYKDDKNYTLIETMMNLTIENVKILFIFYNNIFYNYLSFLI